MKELRRILSFVRRAVEDYDMIEEGDRIAVGISGGKDSLTLLAALAGLRRFYPKKFDLVGVTVDLGLPDMDFTPVENFCRSLDVPFHREVTEISRVVFDTRKESNPCSLCAKMRRGALHAAAKAEGCSKVALGHHFDDAVETFLLNLFFEGRLGSFSPVTYLSQRDLTLIRPMIYAKEKDVAYFARHTALPVVQTTCPEDKATERTRMKELLKELEGRYPGLRHRIFGAMCRGELDGYKRTERLPE